MINQPYPEKNYEQVRDGEGPSFVSSLPIPFFHDNSRVHPNATPPLEKGALLNNPIIKALFLGETWRWSGWVPLGFHDF